MQTWRVGLRVLGVLVLVIGLACEDGYAERRNFVNYEKFGPYTVNLLEDSSKVDAELRSFLWSHWRERRLGYAIVTKYTVEEARPFKAKYFVEPEDGDGRWHIKLEWEVRKGHYHKSGKFVGVSVERMAIDSRGRKTGETIPDNEARPASSYVLLLKDKRARVYPRL